MFYTFEARAGVDLSKAEIDVNKHNRTIDITLPAPYYLVSFGGPGFIEIL